MGETMGAAGTVTLIEFLAVAGPLPIQLLERLVGAEAIDEHERHARVAASEAQGLLGLVESAPRPATGVRTNVARQIAATLESGPTIGLPPQVALRLGALLGAVDVYSPAIVRAATRTALLHGDLETAAALTRDGLRHEPENVDLLHLQAMALEALGRHGAATSLDASGAGLNDAAWLGRWASNLFLSTGRAPAQDQLGNVDDERREMTASLAWIHALEGDVGTVAQAVNTVLDDPRSSAQAVVWACVAGAVPAALDGRPRIADALVAHSRDVLSEAADRLSPFADLQVGLVDSLTRTRSGRAGEAAELGEKQIRSAAGPFLAETWMFFTAMAHRELGHFEAGRDLFVSALDVVDTDPFGLVAWAESEMAVCAAMIGDGEGDRAGAGTGAPVPADTHGLFRSCLFRNRAWIVASHGNVDEALTALDEATEVADALGQNIHLALALLDIARFGEPRRAAGLLTQLSEAESSVLVTVADAVGALADDSQDRLVTAAVALADADMYLQASELLHLCRSHAKSDADLHHVARHDLFGSRPERPTPIFAENKSVAAMLTKRERDVALRCAAGLSSRAVAGGFEISTRTVDNLLGRAYRKCGFADRSELRSWIQPYASLLTTPPSR